MPRVCGDYAVTVTTSEDYTDSTPLVQGIPCGDALATGARGLNPASAGSTLPDLRRCRVDQRFRCGFQYGLVYHPLVHPTSSVVRQRRKVSLNHPSQVRGKHSRQRPTPLVDRPPVDQ